MKNENEKPKPTWLKSKFHSIRVVYNELASIIFNSMQFNSHQLHIEFY